MEEGHLHKIVRTCFSNLLEIRDKFANASWDVQNEIPAAKFGAQLATICTNRAPHANTPFSEILKPGYVNLAGFVRSEKVQTKGPRNMLRIFEDSSCFVSWENNGRP